jgi:hypothetical protein
MVSLMLLTLQLKCCKLSCIIKKQRILISSALTHCSSKLYTFLRLVSQFRFRLIQKCSYILNFYNTGTISCFVACLLLKIVPFPTVSHYTPHSLLLYVGRIFRCVLPTVRHTQLLIFQFFFFRLNRFISSLGTSFVGRIAQSV